MNIDEELLNFIFNSLEECIVIVDENGIVTMMSNGYKEFLGCTNPEGRHVTEVIPNTKLHIVAKTGLKEVGELQEVNNHKMISMRVPIIINGKVAGAIGKVMFKDLNNFKILSSKISNLEKELQYYKNELDSEKKAKYNFNSLMGKSMKFKQVVNFAQRAAKGDSSILITGESGTGKELFAQAIHNGSKRALKPFVKVNCAAIPAELFESEMFGYESGSFTGASKNGKMGLIQQAHQGTLFLDEIGEMPLTMQVKMLKVLQEKKFKAIGSQKESNVDFRLVTATNRDLRKMVDEGKFRLDLYYRLNVISVEIPPLRKRPEDITALIHYYLDEMNKKYDTLKKLHPLTFQAFLDYEWPGNTRELANALERLVLTTDSLVIMPNQLPIEIMQELPSSLHLEECESLNLNEAIQAIERKLFEKAQEKATTTYEMAALLGISQPTVVRKLKKLKREKRE